MLWAIAIILILIWTLGMVMSFTLNGYLHVLVYAAVLLLLIRIIKGPKKAVRS